MMQTVEEILTYQKQRIAQLKMQNKMLLCESKNYSFGCAFLFAVALFSNVAWIASALGR